MGTSRAAGRLGAIVALCAQCALAQAWQPVKAAAIPDLFAGKELTDGAHFAYRFAAAGIFGGTEMGKDVRGRWRVEAGQLCMAWAGERVEEECYDVLRAGEEIRLLKNGSEAWSGSLLAK